MFLSQADLKRLTGETLPAKQVLWLQREKFQYRLDVAGRPVVLVAEAEARMSTPAPLWTVRRALQDMEL